MAVTEKIEISVEATNNTKKWFDNVKDDIKGFNERIKSDTAIKLSLNVANIKSDLREIQEAIKLAKKTWDTKIQIQLEARSERLKQELTQAQRELRNFARTWSQDVSVLGKLFQWVWQEIEKTREELIKAWKSTKELDIIASKANIIEKEFKEWKISIQQYWKELNKLSNEAKWLTPNLSNLSVKLWDLAKWFLIYKWVWLLKDAFIWAWKTSLEFESALAWVNKTLDVTPEQLSKIDDWLKAMTTRIPIAYTELAKIAEVWWQLWVWAEDILKFTETVAKISVTTNLTSEEAATDFARIANVTWEPLENIDKMASSVVDLWNNFAANEKEILNFATNIAWAWKIAWLTAGSIFWISTAFTSIWIEAEAGWTAVQKALLVINTAVATWNDKLAQFAELSGKSKEQFAKDWKSDAWKTFSDFVAQLWTAWDKWVLILDDLIWTDVRLQRAFLWLAQNSWLLTDAINTWNKAFEENNALEEEAQKRFDTTASKLELQKNKWKVFWDYLWTQLLPLFVWVTSFFTDKLPTGFIMVQNWLAILIWKFMMLWSAISWWFQIALENIKIFWNDVSSSLAVFINWWIWLFQWFIWWAWKLFSNLWSFIWTAFWNIWPLIWAWLNKATKPINDFFNKFIDGYNATIWKLTKSKIEWKVDLWVNFWEIKELPSLTKWVKEEFAKIKWEYDSLWGFILQNAETQKQAYNSNIENIRSSTFKELQIIEDANNSIALEWLKKIDVLKWNADTALWITKDRIDEEIKAENEAIKKYLDNLQDKEDGWWVWWKSKASKQAEQETKAELERQLKLAENLKKLEESKQAKYKQTYETLKNTYWKAKDIIQSNIDESTKSIEKFDEQIKNLKENITDLNEKLNTLDEDRATTLWERNVEILKRQVEIQKELNDLKSEEFTSDRLEQETALNKELNSLLEEKRLIEKNATQAEIDEAKRISELSPTAKFLEDFEEKKKALEEERKLKEQQVSDLEKQKATEQWILEWFNQLKINLDTNYAAKSAEIEKKITDTLIAETAKRTSALEQLRLKAIETAEAMRKAWVNVSLPEASTATNTTNVWWITINWATNPQAVAKEVQKVIINASKNANKGSN